MADATIRVTLLYSPAPRAIVEWQGELPMGSTLRDAIETSGLRARFDPVGTAHVVAGVWGRKSSLDRALRDGDRVEIYRPLTVDPKVARRERFRKQGTKMAGLFAQRRTGAKAGY